MKKCLLVSFFLMMSFLLPSSQANSMLQSTFDSGAEGWTAFDPTGDWIGSWQNTGGNPGGFYQGTETNSKGGYGFWISPDTWDGDWSSYIGGTLSYDFILIKKDPRGFREYDDVRIYNGSDFVSWRSSILPTIGVGVWTEISVQLIASEFAGADFANVMSNVTALWIRGEIIYGWEAEGLDNVYVRPAAPLFYTPVKPCRIVDTRKTSAGIIDANTQRDFRVYGPVVAQGGNADGCPSPTGEPLAAHLNMVAVNPTGKGNLQAFPVGTGTGAGLSVNYNAIDTNLANAGSVKTVTGLGADITVASNFSSAHTVIDVLGYYYPDEGFYYTPVDPCRIVDTRKTSAGIIGANTKRDFDVFGSVVNQGGNPAGCPSTLGVSPRAAHLNMVAVDPIGKGNLQAFPVGSGTGAGLSVNYNTIDTNLANSGTVKTSPDISVASNFSSAHTVIDVLGYYSEEEDLLYTPVTPCRIVDTRKTTAGIIDANTQRDFRVFGPVSVQGGNSSGCSAPMGEPFAAHINMIAVNPTGKGNLQAFPVGAGTGAGLSVNYNTIDTNLANAGTVKTSPDISVASNFSSAHTVIDVLGYYYPAP